MPEKLADRRMWDVSRYSDSLRRCPPLQVETTFYCSTNHFAIHVCLRHIHEMITIPLSVGDYKEDRKARV